MKPTTIFSSFFIPLTLLPRVSNLSAMMSSALLSRLRPPQPDTGAHPPWWRVCVHLRCECELRMNSCCSARSARSSNVSMNTLHKCEDTSQGHSLK